MQITEGTSWMKVVAVTAVVGALVAGGLSYTVTPHYVSSAVISVAPQADPVRPASPEALHERAAARVAAMETAILSRSSLLVIINDPRLLLYTEERKRIPDEDVIQQMRSNIHIQARQSTDGSTAPIVFSISFSYPDQAKALDTLRVLAGQFSLVNVNQERARDDAYRGFWRDMSEFEHTKPAPPPPVGETLRLAILRTTDTVGPNRLAFLAWGLGAGLVVGLLAAVGMRRPRVVRQLGGFALAGFVIACALSYLIPNRFTSTAVMEIAPAMLTEDPLTPLRPAIPATEYLRQTGPQILSFETLSRIIQDRRLNLYSSERATKPMEEVVRNMLENDLRVTPVEGAISAFSISFSYHDRYKAQQALNALMNASFIERQKQARAKVPQMSVAVHTIYERKAGEVLEVLDPASLPVTPVSPNRTAISLAGLVIGLLIGVIIVWRRRPRGADATIVACPV